MRLSLLFAVPVLLLAGCSVPGTPGGSASGGDLPVAGNGTLQLQIPPVSPALKDAFSESGSRALMFSTAAAVTVLTSGGSVVFPKTTFPVTWINDGTGGSLSGISVPAGTGLTVRVDVYNSAVSSTSPVVSGQATGVTVVAGQSTSVAVVCLPNSTSSASFGTANSRALTAGGEYWYTIYPVPGQTYTVTQDNPLVATLVFSPTGAYLGKAVPGTPYTLSSSNSSYHYVGIAAESAQTSQLTLTPTAANEGTAASPIQLTLDSPRTFTVGSYEHGDNVSYYRFTAGSGDHFLSLSIPSASLYASLSTVSGTTGYGDSIALPGWLTNLTAGATYYLKVTNSFRSAVRGTGTLVGPTVASADRNSEGTPTSPIALTLGTPRVSKVGAFGIDQTSYYSFTTGAVPFTEITVTNQGGAQRGIGWTLETLSGNQAANSTSTQPLNLSANTGYRLRVAEASPLTSQEVTTFSLLVKPMSVPTPTVLPYNTLTAGTIASAGTTSWYSVTVPGPGYYAVAWEDSYQQPSGAGNTVDVAVSAFAGDLSSAYFRGADSGYPSPYSITVAGTGPQTVLLAVSSFSGNSTGAFHLKVSPNSGSLVISVQ